MGTDPGITSKSSKLSQKDSEASTSSGSGSGTSPEDPLSDDEMEQEYRSLLIRKQDQKTDEEPEKPIDQSK